MPQPTGGGPTVAHAAEWSWFRAVTGIVITTVTTGTTITIGTITTAGIVTDPESCCVPDGGATAVLRRVFLTEGPPIYVMNGR